MKRALLVAVVAMLGACGEQPDSAPGAIGNDFALTSTTIALPDDIEPWPAGTTALQQHCSACHSAGMITTQPALRPEQWGATVKKMREVYKAPIAEGDVPAVLAELARLPAAAAAPAAATP